MSYDSCTVLVSLSIAVLKLRNHRDSLLNAVGGPVSTIKKKESNFRKAFHDPRATTAGEASKPFSRDVAA